MILVIAEKPSVAQALAKVLGAKERKEGHYSGKEHIVTWCLGHLAEYGPPEIYDEKYRSWKFSDLPIVPEKWELSIAEDKKKQVKILKDLTRRDDLEYIVNACDAGREGELIFKRACELTGSAAPVKRLWISSMEDTAIRDGFARLKDGKEYEKFLEASVCRAKADWLIGINASRAFTAIYGKRFAVGRVQTPTLAMLVERQAQMDGFKKEAFYTVALEGEGLFLTSQRMEEETDCDALVERCQGKTAVVTKVEKKQKKTMPPRLYDLTTLQREANRFFGYTARETLAELQELYEKKLVSYPRTDSQYLTTDMEKTVMGILDALPKTLPFLDSGNIGKNVGIIIDNEKVSDHHALIPTKESVQKDLGNLPEKQRHLFQLIGQRLAQAVSDVHVYEEAAVTAECEGHEFHAKGKSTTCPGFMTVAAAFRASIQANEIKEKSEEECEEPALREVREGAELSCVHAEKKKRFTAAPRPYTEDTLLAAMEAAGNREFDEDTEKKGLGTPATRAAIIEKLVSSGYAMRKGRQILPTNDGADLIAVVPDHLKSAAMTAEWENRLLLVERGQLGDSDFMMEILDLLDEILKSCEAIPKEETRRFREEETIGACPICESPVYEGKRNFYCSGRDCSFTLWKENRYLSGMGKRLDKNMAMELLEKGSTHVEDFHSKRTGKDFAADLLLEIREGCASFSLAFPERK